ncbi:methyltransferase domain protein [Oesophagostomum dentatum]|uniref:Methyltransferase domain protein n=1 Tax=Oesophagostomum dentatum TaxID=61180 RepID=A0A0B1T0L0_OESDE|nr:methyltransferase domain protein [Oesophagostomum dentatum]
MECLDVGCGKGFHASFFADNFPKSNFTGVDITVESIHAANLRRKDNGQPYNNLKFFHMDAAKLSRTWTDTFDLVTIFDACHDQMRPDLVSAVSSYQHRFFSSVRIGYLTAELRTSFRGHA